MNYTKIAVKGAATVLIISLLAAFLGYIVRLVLARNLSIEDFGLFYSVFAFLGALATFKSLGIDSALVRFIPKFLHSKKYDEVKSSIVYVVVIQLITNIIIIAAIYLLASYLSVNFFKSEGADIVLRWLAVAFFIDSFVLILKYSFQGFKSMFYFAGIDLSRMLIILAIVVVLFRLNFGLLSPIIAYIIAPAVLMIVFGCILLRKIFPQYFKSEFFFDGRLFKKLSKYGILIMAVEVGAIILGQTDVMLITYFIDLKAVALYSVALPTSKLFIYFPRAIGGIMIPLTAELWAKKEYNVLKAGLLSLYKYSLIIIMPLALVMLSFSELILAVLFGNDYLPASNALKILSIGTIFAALYSINVKFFAGIGKPEIINVIIYSAAIFNLAANLVMIPWLGIVGAALSTTISYIIMMVIGLIGVRKYIEMKFPVKIWLKTSAASLIFVAIIYFLKKATSLNVWVEAFIVLFISGIAYTILLFLFKIISMGELKGIYNRVVKR